MNSLFDNKEANLMYFEENQKKTHKLLVLC